MGFGFVVGLFHCQRSRLRGMYVRTCPTVVFGDPIFGVWRLLK